MSVPIPPFVPPTSPLAVHQLALPAYGKTPLEVHSHGYRYRVTGNTLLPDLVIRSLLLGAKDPKAAITALNDAYHRAGYFLVAIKATEEDRFVPIEVIQGQLTQMHIAPGMSWFFEGLRYRSNLKEDSITYDSVLANAYAQRNGERLQIGFSPSSNPGGSAMQVNLTPVPGFQALTGDVLFGNYGSRYSGRYLTGGSVSYSPGLGLNFNFSGTTGLPSLTTASEGSQYSQYGLGASSITPWGVYGFNAQWVRYHLGNVAFPVNPTGKIFSWSLTGSQLLYASERSRWSVMEGYNHVSNHEVVYPEIIPGGYPLLIQNYNYFDVGTQYNTSYRLFSRPGSFNASLTYNQGFNGSHGTLENHTPGSPSAQFHYFVASLSFNQSLPDGMSASFSASGQGAFNTLPQNNQWVLGGFGSLSAYYPGVLEGDSGYSARVQLQSPGWMYHGFRISTNLFAEDGATTFSYLSSGQTPWQSLSDIGVGATLQSPWGTNISVLSALPVGWNHVTAAQRRASRVDAYFVLTQNF